MGDQNTVLLEADARHLLRRTGFGATASKVATFTGMTRGAAADALLKFKPARFRPRGKDIDRAHNSWVKYMISTRRQLQEKLVLFWHDHFATSDSKVENKDLMTAQNKLLRQNCIGDFKVFVKAINQNAAMIEYLDTVRNFADEPNENYARELQELFTLGVKDLAGNANYAQEDIVQIARAFSGWDYNSKGKAVFNDYAHDFYDNGAGEFASRGPKVIYKNHGQFLPMGDGRDYTLPDGEGAVEIDQVIDLIFQHKDSDGKLTVARYIAKKLLEYFGHAGPSATVIDAVIADSAFGVADVWSIKALVRAILVHDFFYDTAIPTTTVSVKWPIDFVVATLRTLKVRLKSVDAYVNGGDFDEIEDQLTNMGQTLLQPPSVFGWDWEDAWLSSATLLARYNFARDITSAHGNGVYNFRPLKLIPASLTDPADIVDAVTTLLGVFDQLSSTERTALITYLGVGPLDLHDYDTRHRKLHGLFALVMQSPAYQLH